MRRSLSVLVALVLLAGGPLLTTAQDTPSPEAVATPDARATPGPIEVRELDELILRATIERSEAAPVALRLLRIELDPDGASPLHAHPGLELGVVESGALVVRVEGQAVLLPAAVTALAASEPVPTGVEVSLGPGDRIAYAPGTLMTFRNPGPEPTTLLAATVLPAGPDAPPGAVYPGGPPTAEETAGVRSQVLGEATVDGPQGSSAVTLERFRVGSGEPVPGFPGPVLAVVQEGALRISVVEGTYELPATAPPASPEADGEIVLAAGQAIVFPTGIAATEPIGGAGSVTLLRLGVIPLDQEAATAVPTASSAITDPSAIPVGSQIVVVVPEARLRAAPSLDAEVLAGLPQGSVLVVTGPPVADPSYVWYPVQTLDEPALTGYIAAELVAPAP